MLIPLSPVKFQRRPAKARPSKAAPPAPPPELVAASFDSDAALLMMAFDEEINIDALDLSQIFLNDQPVSGIPHLDDPQMLRIIWEGPAPEGDIELTASDSTGIVAAVGGAPWGGTPGVALPFP